MALRSALKITLIGVVLVLAACGGGEQATPTEMTAHAAESPEVELIGDSIRGGLLYDEWWPLLGMDAPAGDQPLWATQSTNERNGADTWRCKECHGWDYKGADGAYGSGSHFTGFAGVLNAAGKGSEYVLGALQGETNSDHDFSTMIDEQALIDLTLFIVEETMDYDQFVGEDKMAVGGDVEVGEELFQSYCADCHGPEGTVINFRDAANPEYVANMALGNPWEFSHKMRFGQPGQYDMPSGIDNGWTLDEQLAVLAYAQSLPTAIPVSESGLLPEGGLLYDKWWAVLGMDAPAGDQPLWATQSTNERSGTDTWRCKECHGWDYKGANGAYGSGSHFTGFPGVFDASSRSAEELTDWLDGTANADHDFSAYLGEDQINALVAFIQGSLVDMAQFISDNKAVNGDPDNGEVLYNTSCTGCHGADGQQINFGDAANSEYVGDIASDNPWEFFHKTAFGQPGASMPAGANFGWSTQDLADLLSYAQTLPTSSAISEPGPVSEDNLPSDPEGGLLYDKWWAVLGIDAPAGDQPLWATQSTNERSGTDTWRCKECHGWDYKGADGAYGSGSHFTGFPGVFGASSRSAEELTGWLDGTANADHDFSAYLGEDQINALVAFIQGSLVDMAQFISDNKAVNGDPDNGEVLYNTSCTGCHGADGQQINFGDAANSEYVGDIANDNPWEFFHKAAFGQPGTFMPTGVSLGWSTQDLADLLSYAQTLPTE